MIERAKRSYEAGQGANSGRYGIVADCDMILAQQVIHRRLIDQAIAYQKLACIADAVSRFRYARQLAHARLRALRPAESDRHVRRAVVRGTAGSADGAQAALHGARAVGEASKFALSGDGAAGRGGCRELRRRRRLRSRLLWQADPKGLEAGGIREIVFVLLALEG